MTPLSGKLVRIRPLEEEDRKDLFKWVNNPDSLGEFISSHLQSYKEFEKYLDATEVEQHRTTFLVIERLDENSKVGYIAFWPSREGDYGITIGYALGEVDQRSKGFTTEAVELLVNYLVLLNEYRENQRPMPMWKILDHRKYWKEMASRKKVFCANMALSKENSGTTSNLV